MDCKVVDIFGDAEERLPTEWVEQSKESHNMYALDWMIVNDWDLAVDLVKSLFSIWHIEHLSQIRGGLFEVEGKGLFEAFRFIGMRSKDNRVRKREQGRDKAGEVKKMNDEKIMLENVYKQQDKRW